MPEGFIRDPVQGLEDFVQDIKPYHTKIVEVLVEYIYQETISVSITDEMSSTATIEFDRSSIGCPDGFGTGPFDFLAGNFEPGVDIQSLNAPGQEFTLSSLSGDITARYPSGKTAKITDSTGNDGTYTVNFSNFNGSETEVTVLEAIPSTVADGELSAYVDDASGLAISNFDLALSECALFGASGDTMAAANITEDFNITVTVFDILGAEWDINGFDPIDGGYDI